MRTALPLPARYREAFPPRPLAQGQSVLFLAGADAQLRFVGEVVAPAEQFVWVRLESGSPALVAHPEHVLVLHEGPFLARSWPQPPLDLSATAAFETLRELRRTDA